MLQSKQGDARLLPFNVLRVIILESFPFLDGLFETVPSEPNNRAITGLEP